MSTDLENDLKLVSARGSSVVLLQRLEGFAVAVVAVALFARTGASWWLFAALWFVPDLSMFGYLVGPCWGARIYNLVHSFVLPAALGLSAYLLHANGLVPVALVWVNHVGVDRFLGYGLKFRNGFGYTHLGLIGSARRAAVTAQQGSHA